MITRTGLRARLRRPTRARTTAQTTPRIRVTSRCPSTSPTNRTTTPKESAITSPRTPVTGRPARSGRAEDESAVARAAVVGCLGGVVADPLEFGDPGVESFDHGFQAPAFARAGSAARVVGVQGVNDLVECETEVLHGFRGADPFHRGWVELAVSGRSAAGSSPRRS